MQKRDYEVRIWREERDGKIKTIVATARHAGGYNGAMYGLEEYDSWAKGVEDASIRVHVLQKRFGLDCVGFAAGFDQGRFYSQIWVSELQACFNLADALDSQRIGHRGHFQLAEETVDWNNKPPYPPRGMGWGHIQGGYLCAGAGGPNSLRPLNLKSYSEVSCKP